MRADAPSGAAGRRAYTVSVDAAAGITTGISAADRATTVRILASSGSSASDLTRPGHVLPVRTHSGGVLQQCDHPEAAVDLARLAGHTHAGVLAALLGDDGELATGSYLREFCVKHGLLLLDARELIEWRLRSEAWLTQASEGSVTTEYGVFVVRRFESRLDGRRHLALTVGDVARSGAPLTYVHRECVGSENFGSVHCDCAARLRAAMRQVADSGCGAIVYLRGSRPGPGGEVECTNSALRAVQEPLLGQRILSELGIRRHQVSVDSLLSCA